MRVGLEIVLSDGKANHVGSNHALEILRVRLHVLCKYKTLHDGALRVSCKDEGASAIEVFKIVVEGSKHIRLWNRVEGFFTIFHRHLGQCGHVALPVERSIDIGDILKSRCLHKRGSHGRQAHGRLVDGGMYGCALGVVDILGRIDIKHINVLCCFGQVHPVVLIAVVDSLHGLLCIGG